MYFPNCVTKYPLCPWRPIAGPLPTPAAQLDLYSGAIATDIEVTSGGFEYVHSGGQTSETIVFAGGYEIVSSGGAAP